jgi:glycosyltransferase involved in cell wall biosynthesis
MILGVNGIRLLGRRSGVGRCVEALLKSFDVVDHPFEEIRVYTPETLPGDVLLPAVGRSVVVPSVLPAGMWEQLALPRAHAACGVLLCPSYLAPWRAGCPTLLIHHGSYEGYPEAFAWWPRKRAHLLYAVSAHRATRICTVSEHSRRDIARFYRVAPDKISVIPDGVDTQVFRRFEDVSRVVAWRRRATGGDDPFLLYVGKETARRNLPQLVAAFAALRAGSLAGYKLVLVGVDLAKSGLAAAIARLDLASEVIGLPYLSHEEVALAYNAAELFIYPSSYEGFGMPVLEAMACGTPTIALDNTAFPEFAGGVAELLPDARVETLSRGIERVLGDAARRGRMAREGPARASDYTWPAIAAQYVALLERVAETAEDAG